MSVETADPQPDLWGAIIDVHMTTTGASERRREDQLRDVQFLRDRLENWKRSNYPFDDAVKVLVAIAIYEWESKYGKV